MEKKKIKGMKVYVLIGLIPYSVDNEVEVCGVFDSKEGAEKGWNERSHNYRRLEEYEIEEFDIQMSEKDEHTEEMRKEEKYYFVVYTMVLQSEVFFCNDTIMENPVEWIMKKCKSKPHFLYILVFYKEITFKEYVVFNPQYKIIKGSD